MRTRRLLALVAVVATLSSAPAVAAQTTDDESDEADRCAALDLLAIVAVFTGLPASVDDEVLVFEDIDVEEGDVNTPVMVEYPQGVPVLDDIDALRVRAWAGEQGLQSDVACGATTDIDDELVDVDDDRLAAIGRTAGDLSARLGRWALIASAVLFTAVAAFTLYRRWRPRLW